MNRQHILLGVLVVMGVARVGDSVMTSMIQGPLNELRGRNSELRDKIEKGETLLAETRKAGKDIELWQRRALSWQTEQARSTYRNWLLNTIRSAKLRNATVESGSPSSRFGLMKSLPFNVRCRGSLKQITSALFAFEQSDQLHKVVSFRLTPSGRSGQFEFSASVEALMLPKARHKTKFRTTSRVLVSKNRSDYDVIADDNIFGIGASEQDPMQTTILSAVTWRNGKPIAWITEQSEDTVHKIPEGGQFKTAALHGRVIQLEEKSVVVESAGETFSLSLGQSFAEATAMEVVSASAGSPTDGTP